MDLEKEIKNNKVVLLVLSADEFNDSVFRILKILSKKNRISYVSINKGYSALVEAFEKNKINTENFFFIDCITKTLVNPKKEQNCAYVSSPNSLTEISLILNKELEKSSNIIIIDSLSTLAIYHSSSTISKFLSRLSQQVKSKEKVSSVFLISSADKGKEVFAQTELVVDKVIQVD